MAGLRERLVAELAASQARVEGLQLDFAQLVMSSADSNADDEHDPEGPTIAFERQQLDAVLTSALAARADLRAALAQLDDGTYGICASCGQPIAPARLEARPQARTCIGCASTRASG